jgi:hypothetical protein
MVLEHQDEHGSQWAAIGSIAEKIGCSAETLPNWVRQAERDQGRRPGLTTEERQRPASGALARPRRRRAHDALAPIIGTLFFPADDPVAPLLAAFGVFAIGFAARPVGGAIFGYIGDRAGRKPDEHSSMKCRLAAMLAADSAGYSRLMGEAVATAPTPRNRHAGAADEL